MTDAEPQLNVLALNSGSSSLKFGLYGVGPSRIERLLSGEAESIGDKSTKCHAKTRTEAYCSPKRVPFLVNGKQSSVSEGFSSTPDCRCRPQSGIELSMAVQNSASIASLTILF